MNIPSPPTKEYEQPYTPHQGIWTALYPLLRNMNIPTRPTKEYEQPYPYTPY